MGFWLLPGIVLAFFIGTIAVQKNHAEGMLPTSNQLQALQRGQIFVKYRDAVSVYLKNNPGFTGTVTASALAAQGTSFSADFLALAGNAITATGSNGRVITCYAALPTGSLQEARNATGNDASLGMASGSTWTSAAPGATAQPLATTVPNGAVVSVTQIGS